MIDLAGVLIPATTPYDSEGEVDRAAMRSNVARWMASLAEIPRWRAPTSPT